MANGFTAENLITLLPFGLLGATVLLLMLAVAIKRNLCVTTSISMMGVLAAWVSTFYVEIGGVTLEMFQIDSYALFLVRLILLIACVLFLFADRYMRFHDEPGEELFVLFMLSTLGACLLVTATHMMSVFVSLELLSLPVLALVPYMRSERYAAEGGTKFLVLAGVSTAFLLFGFALLYADTASMDLSHLVVNLISSSGTRVLFLTGMAFVLVGVGFKLSLAPFHIWAPDVLQAASLPVMGFLSTVSKIGALGFFLRFYMGVQSHLFPEVNQVLQVLAIVSMLLGNWMALYQTSVKRLLAYSSVGHMGIMMVALLSLTGLGVQALLFYLTQYSIAMMCIVGVLLWIGNNKEDPLVADMRGLAYSHPFAAGALLIALLSLVGVPLTAGFMGKYWVLVAGASQESWWLLLCVVVSSALGLFAYFRIIAALFMQAPRHVEPKPVGMWERYSVAILALLVLFLGIMPFWLSTVTGSAQIVL